MTGDDSLSRGCVEIFTMFGFSLPARQWSEDQSEHGTYHLALFSRTWRDKCWFGVSQAVLVGGVRLDTRAYRKMLKMYNFHKRNIGSSVLDLSGADIP